MSRCDFLKKEDAPSVGGSGIDFAYCLLHKLYAQHEESKNRTSQFIGRILAEFLIVYSEEICNTNSEFLFLYEMVSEFNNHPPEDLPNTLKSDFQQLALIFQDLANGEKVFRGEPDWESIGDLNIHYIAEVLLREINCPGCHDFFHKVRTVEEKNELIRCPKCNQLIH